MEKDKKRPRTEHDFEVWYKASKGDPWGYGKSLSIARRFAVTIKKLKNVLPGDYSGTIIEFGCFDGSFTVSLIENYPKAKIICNDISRSALERAKSKLQPLKHPFLEYLHCDMFDIDRYFDLASGLKGGVILALESLYYLNKDEVYKFLINIRNYFDDTLFICSLPIIGNSYFYEDEIFAMFRSVKINICGIKTLNLRRLKKLERILLPLCDLFVLIRRLFANQVLYICKEED